MIVRQENFMVITGGPGVGKTTLLLALGEKGYTIIPEDARRIIKEQIKSNGSGLPWRDRDLYTSLMFNAGVKSYKAAKENPSSLVFFDRSTIDAICYANMMGLPLSPSMQTSAKNNLYNKKVFILPPWEEIYETDDARKQTWEEAVFTFEWLKKTYKEYDYDLIEVPFGTVEQRAGFVLECIRS